MAAVPVELTRVLQKVEAGDPLTPGEFAALESAAARDPGPATRLAVAHALLNADEDRRALELLDRLARTFASHANVHLARARALAGLERHRDAEAALDQVLRLNPGDPEALKVKAVLALRRGEHQRAGQLVQEALSRDPFDAESRLLKEELEAPPPLPARRPASTSAAIQDAAAFARTLTSALTARKLRHRFAGRDLMLALPDGEVARVGLQTLYASYVEGGLPLLEAVERLCVELEHLAPRLPRTREEVLARVLPVLRDPGFVESAGGSVHREGPAGLWVYYVYEDPQLVRYVPEYALSRTGLSVAELDEAAWSNLSAHPTAPIAARPDGVFVLARADGHDGARLLTAAQRGLLAKLAPGPWRVALGSREYALVATQGTGAAAALDSFATEPDGIFGRFTLTPEGLLTRGD